jgi:hypothetical protein
MTIRSYLKYKSGEKMQSSAFSCVLPEQTEQNVAAYIIILEKWQLSLTRVEVLSLCQIALLITTKKTFKNKLTGKYCFWN